MRYFHAESGFSLTEVMTAVVVFSLSLAGFSSMQITAIKLNARAYVTTQMTTVAQEQMEELLSLSFTNTFTDPLLQDNDSAVGQGTTYCVLYPPEGIRPCKDPTFQTSYPSSQRQAILQRDSPASRHNHLCRCPLPSSYDRIQGAMDSGC